eukprot:gene24623-33091_t
MEEEVQCPRSPITVSRFPIRDLHFSCDSVGDRSSSNRRQVIRWELMPGKKATSE